MPADTFRRPDDLHRQFTWRQRLGQFLRNGAGFLLVLVGLVLAIPGVPGQGLLMMLLGLVLMDIPHKRKWELRLLRLPAVHHGIDRLRARFGKPPLDIPNHPPVY